MTMSFYPSRAQVILLMYLTGRKANAVKRLHFMVGFVACRPAYCAGIRRGIIIGCDSASLILERH